MVGFVFLPNPDNLPCINHKDENKSNNQVDNLEWCTIQYNNTYGTRLDKLREYNRCRGCPESIRNKIKDTVTKIQGRAINQYDKSGNFIATYCSTMEVERSIGIPHNLISAYCIGAREHKEFIFKYKED